MEDSYFTVNALSRSVGSQSSRNQRQFTKLDVKPSKPAEYTTFYTKSTTRTTSHTADHHAYSAQPGSTVIEAFKELQRKVKLMEEERYQACQIRDDLKAKLALEKRNQHITRSKSEYGSAEALLSIRAVSEQARREKEELESKVHTQQEIQDSIQRKLSAQRNLIATLQDDVDRNRTRILAAEKKQLLLEKDLKNVKHRNDQLEVIRQSSPEKSRLQQKDVLHSASGIERQVGRLRKSCSRVRLHISSLEAYIDLIVKVNGDLIETLHTREQVKKNFIKTARSLSPPPRYTWPKDVQYHDILHIINHAAAAQAQAAAEETALHVTEQAMKAIIDSVSPKKKFSSPTKQRYESPYSAVKSKGMMSTVRSSLSFNDLDETQNKPATEQYEPSYIDYHAGQDIGASETLLQSGQEQDVHEKYPSMKNSLYNQQLNYEMEEDEVEESDSDYVPPARTKKVKKMTRRSKEVPTRKLTKRREVLTKVLARQGAVLNATRLAAAANAVSTTVRVSNTPERIRGKASTTDRESKSTENVARSRVDFIPSSKTQANEFNIIASVSKASRAAKQLNATIASKVKSLHQGGIGRLFSEVPRIELADLKGQLKAAKKLRVSF